MSLFLGCCIVQIIYLNVELGDSYSLNIKQARPLLEEYTIEELIDPRLGNHYSKHEVYCMLHAASLCIQCHPQCRSCMSQVKEVLNPFCQTWLAPKDSQLCISWNLIMLNSYR